MSKNLLILFLTTIIIFLFSGCSTTKFNEDMKRLFNPPETSIDTRYLLVHKNTIEKPKEYDKYIGILVDKVTVKGETLSSIKSKDIKKALKSNLKNYYSIAESSLDKAEYIINVEMNFSYYTDFGDLNTSVDSKYDIYTRDGKKVITFDINTSYLAELELTFANVALSSIQAYSTQKAMTQPKTNNTPKEELKQSAKNFAFNSVKEHYTSDFISLAQTNKSSTYKELKKTAFAIDNSIPLTAFNGALRTTAGYSAAVRLNFAEFLQKFETMKKITKEISANKRYYENKNLYYYKVKNTVLENKKISNLLVLRKPMKYVSYIDIKDKVTSKVRKKCQIRKNKLETYISKTNTINDELLSRDVNIEKLTKGVKWLLFVSPYRFYTNDTIGCSIKSLDIKVELYDIETITHNWDKLPQSKKIKSLAHILNKTKDEFLIYREIFQIEFDKKEYSNDEIDILNDENKNLIFSIDIDDVNRQKIDKIYSKIVQKLEELGLISSQTKTVLDLRNEKRDPLIKYLSKINCQDNKKKKLEYTYSKNNILCIDDMIFSDVAKGDSKASTTILNANITSNQYRLNNSTCSFLSFHKAEAINKESSFQ